MPQTSLSLLERVRRDGDAPSWARLLSVYEPLLTYWLYAMPTLPLGRLVVVMTGSA